MTPTLTRRNLATIDQVIIGLHLFIVFAIGLYFARKERRESHRSQAGKFREEIRPLTT